jgi:hypothetical protein
VNLPADFDPCEYFRQRRDDLLREATARSDLQDFRNQPNVQTEFREWLDDTEINLAIAAVTLAISGLQNNSQGFAHIPQWCIQMLESDDPSLANVIRRCIRPGRPMLVPLSVKHHYILLIIQLDDRGLPTFSVMDSKAYRLRAGDRVVIHNWIDRLIRASRWWENILDRQTMKDNLPACTIWLPASQQPSDAECGYYVILNAWALALGLEPDPAVHIDWNDEFFQDLKDIIHLARMGRVDWIIIYAFLRCRGFVRDGYVPEDRQFVSSVELRDEKYLETAMQDREAEDTFHFSGEFDVDIQAVRIANRCRFPAGGRRHNNAAAFPSDNWNEETRLDYASELARKGKLNLNSTATQVRQAARTSRNDRGFELHNQLRVNCPEYSAKDRNELLEASRRYLSNWHTGREELQKAVPCDLVRDTIDFYRYILQPTILGSVLRSTAFDRREWRRQLSEEEVNLGIAAVVEAIDRLQSEHHEEAYGGNRPFASGFSLATSGNIGLALIADEPAGRIASRPRRCFLMPLTVAGQLLTDLNRWRQRRENGISPGSGAGHHLLAVVQEERDDDGIQWEINFYDSARNIFGGSLEFLSARVRQAIENLRWTSHRNADLETSTTYVEVRCAQQTPGHGWRCGPHTVINAWILAMGLHPDPEATFGDDVFEEFHILARAAVIGLLDWRTLVAWFFCHRLTSKRDRNLVQPTRQFPTTQFWASEAELDERIRDIYEGVDEFLELIDEADVPYEFDNNVAPDVDAEKDEEEEEEALSREHDILEPLVWTNPVKHQRVPNQRSDDVQLSLNRSNVDVSELARNAKRRPAVDELIFLEGY